MGIKTEKLKSQKLFYRTSGLLFKNGNQFKFYLNLLLFDFWTSIIRYDISLTQIFWIFCKIYSPQWKNCIYLQGAALDSSLASSSVAFPQPVVNNERRSEFASVGIPRSSSQPLSTGPHGVNSFATQSSSNKSDSKSNTYHLYHHFEKDTQTTGIIQSILANTRIYISLIYPLCERVKITYL